MLHFTVKDSHFHKHHSQDRFQDFECECVEGYEGDTCGDETDECDPNPCQNGGTCNVSCYTIHFTTMNSTLILYQNSSEPLS